MLEIKNVSKQYENKKVVNSISYSFPNSGFYCLCGPSGCGKTTLLNIISSIDCQYEGEVIYNNHLLRNFSESQKEEYRLKDIGYVFQDFNLFNLDSVFNNVLFPLDTSSNASYFVKKRKVEDLLSFVNLLNKKNCPVKNLSGGEKQRVAIARSLVNEPEILLCDEPSGALDEKSSKLIFSLLKEISKTKLVIVVTHDEELAKSFSDFIIYLRDGTIEKEIQNKASFDIKQKIPIFETKSTQKKPRVSLSFIIRHILANLKNKKIRSLVTNAMTSLGLVGVGMSIMLVTSLSTNIKEAFSQVINDRQIVASLKNPSTNTFGNVFAVNKEEANYISNKYNDDIDGFGVNYLVNFEDFFRSRNEIYLSNTTFRIPLEKYSIRLVNDYKWLSEKHNKILPHEVSNMENDQVVIGFDYESMAKLCFALQIQRNYESLADYIDHQFVTITIDVANNNWQYDDQQLLHVVGIVEDDIPTFYHTSKLWNETIFQEKMRLPSTSNSDNSSYPWTMNKTYYLHTKNDPEQFLNKAMLDEKLQEYVFERANYSYYPQICKIGESCAINRILIFSVDKSCVSFLDINNMQRLEPRLKNFIVSTDLGYSMYTNNLVLGFSHNFYLSNDEEKLDYAIASDSKIPINDYNAEISLPNNVVVGSAFKSTSSGLTFSSNINHLIKGKDPSSNREIVISSGLSKKLNNITIGDYLYVSMAIQETLYDSGSEKAYAKSTIKCSGIVEEEKDVIYSDSMWTVSFFRDSFNISSFYLLPRHIIFDIENSNESDEIINKLNEIYNDYEFSNPAREIGRTIDDTLSYVEVMLLSFSMVALIISIMLFSLVVYMNINESKNEIKLMHYIGIPKKDIKKMYISYGFIIGFIAFVTSSFEILLLNFLSAFVLQDYFSLNFSFSFSLLPFVAIFIVVLFIVCLSSLFIKVKTYD